MTSKYFGEFLVEKGVITEENLVDALIEQLSNTPPLCQVIRQKKILSTQKIFEAFRFQQDNQVEFMQACKAIGSWTQEVQERVFTSLDEIRKPLGHILVSKGLIDLKKLTNMLDEFLSQISVVNTPNPIEVSIVAPTPAVEPEVVAVSRPYVDEDLTECYQPGILMELDETFDEKKKKMVRIALSLVKDNAGEDLDICKKLLSDVFKIVHGLNGLLGLLALDKLSELLNAVEERLVRIQPTLSERTREQVINDTDILTKGIDMAWILRMSILANQNERVFFSEESNRKQFGQLTQELKG
jgi:hypothetical protein